MALSFQKIKIIFFRLAFLLGLYQVFRFLFFLYQFNSYEEFSVQEILISHLIGLRFDVAVLCWVNAPFILFSLTPFKHIIFTRLERITFVMVNLFFISGALVDFELTKYFGKRISRDFFQIAEDIWEQLPQLVLNFWYIPFIFLVFIFLFFKLDRKLSTVLKENWIKSLKLTLPMVILIPSFTFIGVRGGLQDKSIHIQHAFTQGDHRLGLLALNTPYYFLRTYNATKAKNYHFFNKVELPCDYTNRKLAGDLNIIVFIMESFTLEYFERGYMPFLKKLSEQGIYYDKHFASGRRSIDAIPALFDSIPALIDDAFSKSRYGSNKLIGLPQLLQNKGYQNYFFHGGGQDTMGFRTYTLGHGFDHYYSKEDYNGSSTNDDGHWGIYDHAFLAFMEEKLSQEKKNFFAGFFSLSSHQPYSIPKAYQNKFPKGELPIHESIGYADHALEQFFENASKQAWFNKTLFLITADHVQQRKTKKFSNLLGSYRVPLILYHSQLDLKDLKHNKVTSHIDIPVSLAELTGTNPEDLSCLGESIFKKQPGQTLLYSNPYFIYISDHQYLKWTESKSETMTVNFATGETSLANDADSELMNSFKMRLQYFFSFLRDNKYPLTR